MWPFNKKDKTEEEEMQEIMDDAEQVAKEVYGKDSLREMVTQDFYEDLTPEKAFEFVTTLVTLGSMHQIIQHAEGKGLSPQTKKTVKATVTVLGMFKAYIPEDDEYKVVRQLLEDRNDLMEQAFNG